MIPHLSDFTAVLPTSAEGIAAAQIGKGITVEGPFGSVPMLYADYVASGRAVAFVEDFIRDRVLPYYANSHTEASCCGAAMTALRRDARQAILTSVGGDADHAVVFTGSGATSAVNRLVDLFAARRRWFERPVTVLIGPYEHHSNILPWREAGAKVIEIPEAAQGGVDLDALDAALSSARGRVIGSFSAMSNVSGIVSDVSEVTRRLKRAGALAVWDYAGAGPYLPISMMPAPDAPIDAIVTSPHKFIGGPGASGVMVLRRDAVQISKPSLPGGGTVRFVSSTGQDYHDAVELREEGGTPNVVGDIRAALCFMIKDSLGADWIAARNQQLACRLMEAVRGMSRIVVIGKADCNRLPILSFRVRDAQDGFHNFQLATRVLSDRFGVQARGGCACAGPYVLRALGVAPKEAERLRRAILAGDESAKPGFVRLNLSYLMNDAEVDAIIAAIGALPEALDECAAQYVQDPANGTYAPRPQTVAAQ